MAEDVWTLVPDQHQRTVIHIDVDCFYAQVEMVRDPSLRDKPLGIKQKNLMVTSNYVARSMGVKKSMWIQDALKILPDLVLVDGSDLTHYRQFSAEISAVAQSYTPNVERLGLDENFLDISGIVGDYINSECDSIEGHVFGDKENDNTFGDPCGCGCYQRLVAGTHVAKKLRQQILETTGITCCAGVAHNKLLAKLVSGYYKPNQQTVLFPWQVYDVMKSLDLARSIPGIGSTTFKTLEDLGISTVQELQNASLNILYSRFDKETSNRLRDLSYGIDISPVRKSGRPQSIGLEDAFRKVNSIAEVRVKYHTLLERLLKLLAEDGRVPRALKVSVRKFHKEMRFGQRETKQIPVSASLFSAGLKNIPEKSKAELMSTVMKLFHKMVDTTKNYHLTLLGIGFTKFIERAPEGMSISNFFSKSSGQKSKQQSVQNDKHQLLKASKCDLPLENQFSNSYRASGDNHHEHVPISDDDLPEDMSDEDFHKPLDDTYIDSISSHIEQELANDTNENEGTRESSFGESEIKLDSSRQLHVPSDIDRDVFMSLPADLQSEILQSYQHDLPLQEAKNKSKIEITQKNKNVKGNANKKRSLNAFFKNQETMLSSDNKKIKMEQNTEKASELSDSVNYEKPSCSNVGISNKQPLQSQDSNSGKVDEMAGEGSPIINLKARGIDPEVFNSLPKELQDEILKEQTMKRPAVSPSKNVKGKHSKISRDSSSILKYFKKR